MSRGKANTCGDTELADQTRFKHMEFFTSISGMIFSVWMRAIVRISMSVGGTEVLTDYGKHDLAHTLS